MGLGLDALARAGGHADLGFASIEAYALERCDRSATWTRASRRLAARVQDLPQLRRALISGRTSWSMGLELAKVATPEDEAHWLLISGQCTVARFRALVKELRGADSDGTTEEEGEERCTLTVTANREETWLWECTKMLFRHIEGGTTSDLVESVIKLNRIAAEAYATNSRAIRMLTCLGFQHEGTVRESVWRPRPVDEHLFGLLAAEWKR
jgi:hypothetical protein